MAVTLTPSVAEPRATVDFVAVTVAGASQNTLTGYDGTEVATMPGTPSQYPASPEVRYYLTFELASVIRGKSYVFAVDNDGGHVFVNYVFPEAGSWTIRLNDAADDSSVQTAAITVS